MPTSVRCPDDSSLPIALAEVRDVEAGQAELHLRRGIAHAVELAEQVQELAHPQPLGQRQVSGGEADVLHRLAAMTREPEAAHLDPAGVG